MRGAVLFAVLALAACSKPEPSFDDRFRDAEKSIAATGAAIDREIKAREEWNAAQDAAARAAQNPTPRAMTK